MSNPPIVVDETKVCVYVLYYMRSLLIDWIYQHIQRPLARYNAFHRVKSLLSSLSLLGVIVKVHIRI
jgi:hypothetical protein